MKNFKTAKTPFLEFGEGAILNIVKYAENFRAGKAALLTGSESFRKTQHWDSLCRSLINAGIEIIDFKVGSEPSPGIVDSVAAELKKKRRRYCYSCRGGGAYLMRGKAVAAMTVTDGSVKDYLEGVGTKSLTAGSFLLAVPTTSAPDQRRQRMQL